jgi:hypothetical protein
MLVVLNRYAPGFVVMPVVLFCRRGGVFKALESGPQTEKQLAKELGANLGHLRVPLRLLESLGWFNRRSDECLEVTR